MIHVQVRLYNMLASLAGTKQVDFDLPDGTTLSGLCEALLRDRSPAFQELIFSEGRLNPYLNIFRKDSPLDADAMDLPLDDGDELLFFPAISGGSYVSA